MNVSNECLQYDSWLSQVLQRPAYGLELEDREAAAGALAGLAGGKRPFVYCKLPCQNLADARWLEKQGFHLADTTVTLAAPLRRGLPLVSGLEIRPARAGDREQVGVLAASSFRYSRFHRDPGIGREAAELIKRRWSESFFSGRRGEQMVVAADQGRVVGYNLLLHRGQDLVIDLIAVDGAWRGRGVARDLIALAQDQAPALERLLVGTQLANRPSLALYQGLGLKLVDAAYVYHLHLD